MANVEHRNVDNIGGIRSLEWFLVRDVISFPKVAGTVITENIVLEENKGPYVMEYTLQSASHSENASQNDAGTVFSATISGFIPRDDEEIRVILQRMQGAECILKYTDQNDVAKLVGTKESPLQFFSSYSTKGKYDNANGYNFRFTQSSCNSAYILNGLITSEIDPIFVGTVYIYS